MIMSCHVFAGQEKGQQAERAARPEEVYQAEKGQRQQRKEVKEQRMETAAVNRCRRRVPPIGVSPAELSCVERKRVGNVV